ncbi:peptidoglycan-binding protein [Agrococcus sp. ARC_14]|uniref:peptidoglycan-binding protein n=1 Tax=Agrococcus sp. ARC_14 TaxID=2919927 RepID=UPI001F0693AA|nr:peptidoglycan-binding protein [Agrococcus sp. ARC_14]MCH1884330.1 peptidoglycan-binding protein [Agrococcus sp. ARC_14]
MGSREGMLNQMRALIGLGEYPPGSNRNKVTAWYVMVGPWCDMAITYAAAHSDNLAAVGGRYAYTVWHAQKFQSMGRWHSGTGGIRSGDIIFFDWSGSRRVSAIDHVGIVEAVHSDGTITTIEGNTSDVCMRRKRTGAYVVGYGRPAYGTGGSPMPPNDGMLRRGSTGTAVRTLQGNLNTVMRSGLAVDGQFGSKTDAAVRSFQQRYGLAVDGVYGPASAATMRAALKGGSTPPAPTPRPPAPAPLVVDGSYGPKTCAALQRALNRRGASLVVDGSFGPLTKRALQRYLGVTADGSIGPITVKALQRHIGAVRDGSWGRATTTALQRKLNAGSF